MSLDVMLLENKIRELKIPATSVAKLAGVTNSQLSDWLRGARPCPGDKFLRIREVLLDVESIIERCRPLVLDLRNPVLLGQWIELWRNDSLKIQVDSLGESNA